MFAGKLADLLDERDLGILSGVMSLLTGILSHDHRGYEGTYWAFPKSRRLFAHTRLTLFFFNLSVRPESVRRPNAAGTEQRYPRGLPGTSWGFSKSDTHFLPRQDV